MQLPVTATGGGATRVAGVSRLLKRESTGVDRAFPVFRAGVNKRAWIEARSTHPWLPSSEGSDVYGLEKDAVVAAPGKGLPRKHIEEVTGAHGRLHVLEDRLPILRRQTTNSDEPLTS